MIKRNVKSRRKIIKNRVGRDCPKCGRPLVYRTNSKTQLRFIGCSNYPTCDYKPQKSIVDYACESLGVNWRPNISSEVFDIFYNIIHEELGAKGSSDEIEYMLGAAYYIDHWTDYYDNANGVKLHTTKVEYNGNEYDGIGFPKMSYYWESSPAKPPASMAFVPQLLFAHALHHDFGVFFSNESDPKPTDWKFELAVEVDVFHTHQLFPERDMKRDRLVSYPVLRLHPNTTGCEPLKWFRKVINHWERKFAI
jgi:ssDNA-binding Zn-finger/Zn-ribbon topoisomerase 1